MDATLVGHCHLSLWVLIEALQRNEGIVSRPKFGLSAAPSSYRYVCCSCAKIGGDGRQSTERYWAHNSFLDNFRTTRSILFTWDYVAYESYNFSL